MQDNELVQALLERATWTAPDGRTVTVQGTEHHAPMPAGDWERVTHTHPGKGSLSLGDLLLLQRLQEVEATTPAFRFIARPGAQYSMLQELYDQIATRVSGDLAHRKQVRGSVDWNEREREINRQLAKRGVIAYDEIPVTRGK